MTVPRIASYEIPVDTCLFSPLQLHARTALRLAFGAVTHSVGTQITPWPKLIYEHAWSFVLVGLRLEPGALTFEHAGRMLPIRGTLYLRHGRKLVEHRCEIGPSCRVSTLWRPVALQGTAELAGLPADADDWLAGHFPDDERIADKPPRALAHERARAEAELTLVTTSEYATTVARDECEVADQWQFLSAAGWVARAREHHALAARDPIARLTLARPLTLMLAEMHNPLYFASPLVVRSSYYAAATPATGDLVVVHETFDRSVHGVERLSFVLLEKFAAPMSA